MNKYSIIVFLLCFPSIIYAENNWKKAKSIEKRIHAPIFRQVDYQITDFGIIKDEGTNVQPIIQQAIDLCSKEGGGKVILPNGRFFCKGPIVLKSNVNLYLSEGCELFFSSDENDYLPVVLTRWEGTDVFNYSPLIYANHASNIAITGKGILNGQGSKNFCNWKKKQKPDQQRLRTMGTNGVPVWERVFGKGCFLRPAFIEPIGCSNILIEGITLIDSPFWVIHPVYSSNVIVRDVTVNSYNYNNDGCDPESCTDVLIENCRFHTGDDAIAIKSGRDQDGWKVGRPAENIIIRNCTMDSKANGICVGSEISGGIRNIFVENVIVTSCNDAIYFKSNLDRGSYICDIWVRNIRVEKALKAVIKFESDYKKSSQTYPTHFYNFNIQNISAGEALESGIDISGSALLPIHNVMINRLTLDNTPKEVIRNNTRNVRILRTRINGKLINMNSHE
ncbi:glycoside hydrolase family 28 protein [Bacteroides ovatus]|uniref:glycoside hydrolase family 28 protein n=1 Tax=Bacteroides ovatus TaxID=28116 RepID=UPI00314558D8